MINNLFMKSATSKEQCAQMRAHNELREKVHKQKTCLYKRHQFKSPWQEVDDFAVQDDVEENDDDNLNELRALYKMSLPTQSARFVENPCYLQSFPEPSPKEPWEKRKIIPLIDPPFDDLTFMIGGCNCLTVDGRMQSLIQSIKCQGYYRLRESLSDMFMILRLKLRKIEADIVLSHIAILHGFQCHCLAKLYCSSCPQGFREILSAMRIKEYVPIEIDFKMQFCPIYQQRAFHVVRKLQRLPQKWARNLKKPLPKRNRKREATATVFCGDVYDCADAAAEMDDGYKKYSYNMLQCTKLDFDWRMDKISFHLPRPVVRLLIFLPLIDYKRQKFENILFFCQASLCRSLNFKESLLLSDTTGDWFQISFSFCQIGMEKDIANSLILDNAKADCSIKFVPPLKENNAIIYVEQWNILLQTNHCSLYLYS